MKLAKLLFVGSVIVGFADWAGAQATLTISDGVDPTQTFTDNQPGDNNPSAGILNVQTSIGTWYLTLVTAQTQPNIGSTTTPIMNLYVEANSHGAGNLEITFSDNNFGPVNASAQDNLSGFVFGTPQAPTTVAYSIYSDSGNNIGAETTLVDSFPTQPLGLNATNYPTLAITAPSSLTQDIQLSASGATSLNVNASLQVVPEPSVIALGGLGLAALAVSKRFRKNT